MPGPRGPRDSGTLPRGPVGDAYPGGSPGHPVPGRRYGVCARRGVRPRTADGQLWWAGPTASWREAGSGRRSSWTATNEDSSELEGGPSNQARGSSIPYQFPHCVPRHQCGFPTRDPCRPARATSPIRSQGSPSLRLLLPSPRPPSLATGTARQTTRTTGPATNR